MNALGGVLWSEAPWWSLLTFKFSVGQRCQRCFFALENPETHSVVLRPVVNREGQAILNLVFPVTHLFDLSL